MVICHFRQYDFRRNDLDEMNLDEMILDDMNLDDLILDEMIESRKKAEELLKVINSLLWSEEKKQDIFSPF